MLQVIFFEFVNGILRVPLWWYTQGVMQITRFVTRSLAQQEASLSVGVWAKNLFVPMYGSRDIAGRVISFFVRLAQILGRSLFLLVYAIGMLLLLLAYVLLPVLVLVEILIHLVGTFSV